VAVAVVEAAGRESMQYAVGMSYLPDCVISARLTPVGRADAGRSFAAEYNSALLLKVSDFLITI